MRKGRRGDTGPVEMNMVPIMNLFLAMIPFLLSCAAFFQAAVINASVPALGEGAEDSAEEPEKALDKITLNLQITKDGFVLSAQGDQPEEELKKIASKIPKAGDQHDFDRLAKTCKKLHDKYNKSDTVIVLPDKDIRYETIVKSMDAARERIIDPRLDQREPLFSNAVVSSIL